MKIGRYNVRRNPKGNAAFKDSSSVILSAAGTLLMVWGMTPKEAQDRILESIGIEPTYLASASFAITVVAAFIAKHTSVVRERPADPPSQNEEGPDHG